MAAISLVLQIVGLVFLIIGFRSANRNMLLGAALLLWFGAGANDFIHGFIDGVQTGTGA
jgi:hypothetical protein